MEGFMGSGPVCREYAGQLQVLQAEAVRKASKNRITATLLRIFCFIIGLPLNMKSKIHIFERSSLKKRIFDASFRRK